MQVFMWLTHRGVMPQGVGSGLLQALPHGPQVLPSSALQVTGQQESHEQGAAAAGPPSGGVRLLYVEPACLSASTSVTAPGHASASAGPGPGPGPSHAHGSPQELAVHVSCSMACFVRLLLLGPGEGALVAWTVHLGRQGLHTLRLSVPAAALQTSLSHISHGRGPQATALHLVLLPPAHDQHSTASGAAGSMQVYGHAALLSAPPGVAAEVQVLWENMVQDGAQRVQQVAPTATAQDGGPPAPAQGDPMHTEEEVAAAAAAAVAWAHAMQPLLGDLAALLSAAHAPAPPGHCPAEQRGQQGQAAAGVEAAGAGPEGGTGFTMAAAPSLRPPSTFAAAWGPALPQLLQDTASHLAAYCSQQGLPATQQLVRQVQQRLLAPSPATDAPAPTPASSEGQASLPESVTQTTSLLETVSSIGTSGGAAGEEHEAPVSSGESSGCGHKPAQGSGSCSGSDCAPAATPLGRGDLLRYCLWGFPQSGMERAYR